jgi:hypothetical protein
MEKMRRMHSTFVEMHQRKGRFFFKTAFMGAR